MCQQRTARKVSSGTRSRGKLTFTRKRQYVFHQISSQKRLPKHRCQHQGRGGWERVARDGGGRAFQLQRGLGSAETSHERAPSPTAESTGATKLPRRPTNRGQAGPRLSGNARSRRSNAATSVTDRAGLPPEAPGHERKPPPHTHTHPRRASPHGAGDGARRREAIC